MKEKMLSKLEKDRAVGQVTGLQNTLKNIEAMKVRKKITVVISGLEVQNYYYGQIIILRICFHLEKM